MKLSFPENLRFCKISSLPFLKQILIPYLCFRARFLSGCIKFLAMCISVGAGFLFYCVLLIKSMFYIHLCMDINEKSKRSIFIGRNPDPAPKTWLGQKGHRTQRGAAPLVNEYTTIHHQSHNPIVPQCQYRWLFSRCQINALWHLIDSVAPPLDKI